MAGNSKSDKKPRPTQIEVVHDPDEDQRDAFARTLLRPTVQAATTLIDYGKRFGELDLPKLVDALTVQTNASIKGDLRRGEAMLTTQAHTLDAIFNNLARRAINAEYMDHLDRYLKLALRAQSQCRATWEALSAIKNPPVAGYVSQANIAHGHQQVNNAVPSDRGLESSDVQNKLLDEGDDQRLDIGAQGAASGADPEMAPVGKVDRADDGSR